MIFTSAIEADENTKARSKVCKLSANKNKSIDVYHVSTVHPNTDNRIYNKYVRGLVSQGYSVGFICRNSSIIENEGFSYFGLKNRKNITCRVANSLQVLSICWADKKSIFHFHDPELIIVAALLRLRGLNVVYDVHEDNLLAIRQKHYLPGWAKGVIARLVQAFESLAARLFCVVIAEKAYLKRFPGAVMALNYPMVNKEISVNRVFDCNIVELLYTGSVTIDRGLLNYIQLVKQDPNVRLTLVGSMRRDYVDQLKASLDKSELERVTLVTNEDSVPFKTIESHYRNPKYHFGLAVFPRSPHYVDKELTKFFEYAQYSLPVLCSDFPVWEKLIVDNGVGISLSSENPVLDTDTMSMVRQRYGDMVDACAQFSANYSWDSELKGVMDLYARMRGGEA